MKTKKINKILNWILLNQLRFRFINCKKNKRNFKIPNHNYVGSVTINLNKYILPDPIKITNEKA